MRGVSLSYETVREWCLKFGQTYASGLRHKSPRPGDRWHLDEVFLKINGRLHYLWRAVDQDGDVLDILVQSRRDKKAAKKVLSPAIKGVAVWRRLLNERARSRLKTRNLKSRQQPCLRHARVARVILECSPKRFQLGSPHQQIIQPVVLVVWVPINVWLRWSGVR